MRRRQKDKKEIEYVDAPSGYVTMYNYKEPFMKFKEGHGFQGALLFDGVSDKVQCHYCGKWFDALAHHLKREHNMSASEYKDNVGLMQTTALISEQFRAKLIASGLDKRLQNLRNRGKINKRDGMKAETKEKIRQTLRKNGMEMKNLRGTCPEQLIERLLKEYQETGDTPHTKKISFYPALMKTYGTYENACFVAGIPYRSQLDGLRKARNVMKEKSEKKMTDVKDWILEFYKKSQQFPTKADFDNADKSKEYKSLMGKVKMNDIRKETAVRYGVWTSSIKGFRFSKEELLDFLRKFNEINGRHPSYSDAKRGLIPHLSRYSYNFGSWQKALKLAFA